MGLSEQIRRKLIETFKTEQSEHVQALNQGLLALEKSPPPEEREKLLQEVFRAAHSLKGAARSVGVTSIESLGHALEDVLSLVREGELELFPELFDALYEALDAVGLVINQLEKGGSPPNQVISAINKLETAKTDPDSLRPQAALPEAETTAPAMPDDPAEGMIMVSTEKLDKLLDQIDVLLNRQFASAPETPAPLPETPSPYTGTLSTAPANDETIRVSVNKLDELLGQLGELVSAKIRAEQYLGQLEHIQASVAEWHKTWLNSRHHYSDLRQEEESISLSQLNPLLEFITYNQEQLRQFDNQLNDLCRHYANDSMRLALIVNEVQEDVKQLRMLPLTTITANFERMVRDVARTQNKEVTLKLEGTDTELDKRMLEQLKDPLIHLLRNAIAHGLEKPAERIAAGKSERGEVRLKAFQQGNNIIIEVTDDGRGLNTGTIEQAAIAKGLLTATSAEKMTPSDLQQLIFRSGLSTSNQVDDISGRGVGLDIVRQNVESLQGTISVESVLNEGSTFTLTLPLTLATSRGLLIQAGEQQFALPFSAIERMIRIQRQDIEQMQGNEVITYHEHPIPLVRLETLLNLPTPPLKTDRLLVIIIVAGKERLGLVVERLNGEQEIVIKGLGKQLLKVKGLAGATILGSGEALLVLHAPDLIRLGRQVAKQSHSLSIEKGSASPGSEKKKVMVVDDSITTRTLEQNILEGAGYAVTLANNGQEAFTQLENTPADNLPDLVILDVNMPGLNGFELTARLKQNQRYQHIPVVLVTSRDSPEDKARGIQVEADAFIVKSDFNQTNLLDTIIQLI